MSDEAQDTKYLNATDALKSFENRDLSPVEHLDAIIYQAEKISNSVNPFADCYFDEARDLAKQAELKYFQGEARALEGIPLVVKDASAIKGKRTTYGSMLFSNNIDSHTDPAVKRLIDAGAIVFARSSCPEFCWLFTCHSKMWGVTRNPWRLDITPGGSSGGSAAALAAGASTIATGSDSTGSIRQPASQCGVVGYQPPYGRNPLDARSSFDPYCNVGPMARSVGDTILMQNIMSGPHSLDHNSLNETKEIPFNHSDVKGLNIAYSSDLGHYIISSDVRREVQLTLDSLKDAGAKITEIKVDWASECIRLAHLNQEFKFAGILQNAIENHFDKLSDYVSQLYETARGATAEDYRNSISIAGQTWHDHFGPMFENYDAFITPTVSFPDVPASNEQLDKLIVEGNEVTDTETSMTALFNMFNRCPVLSLPSGMTDGGLPVGIQIVGRPYDDNMTFRIGNALEALRPWSKYRPSIS